MNRRHRRATAKQEQSQPAYNPDGSVAPVAPIVAKPESVGLGLRIASRLLLSKWVLKRVQHRQVLGVLADPAAQSGRTDALLLIAEKFRQPGTPV